MSKRFIHPPRQRLMGWLAILSVVFFGLALATSPLRTVVAEDADDDVITEDEQDAAADADGTSDGDGNATPEEGQDSKTKKSYLEWAWDALGISYSLVFLSLSFVLVALFVMNILQARRENMVPAALIEEFEGFLNEKKYQDAYELAKSDESMLGQVLSAGLAKLSTGYQQAIEAMQEVGEEQNMKLEHRLSYMALIGTISPMIGLLGTVQGMIGAFETLATTSKGAPDATDLAGNISTALFTTLCGLFVAIPAIAAYNILRNRTAQLVLEVGIVSESLMGRFQPQQAAKKTPTQ